MIILTIIAYIVTVVCTLVVGTALLFDIADCNYINTLKEKTWVAFSALVVCVICVGSLYIVFKGLF